MPLELKRVSTAQERLEFIRMARSVYPAESPWVPPLLSERQKFLDPQVNPFFKNAEVEFYLAREGAGTPVGRIALIHDRRFNEFHAENTGLFGFFESVDDEAVAAILFRRAMQWAEEKGFDRVLGPFNFSTNHECGILVDGFDRPPTVGMTYNPPYYPSLIEGSGFRKAKDLLSFKLHAKVVPEYLDRAAQRISRRNRFRVRNLRIGKFDEELKILWDIYNAAWEKNWGFVPLVWEEFHFCAHELRHIVNPEFCLIAEIDSEPCGFCLGIPDINPALKSMNGKMFPLGWLRFLLGKRNIDVYRVSILGTKRNFRKMGIEGIFYHEVYKSLIKNQISRCEMSWILEDNRDIIIPIQRLGGSIYKRHRIYERDCGH